MTETGTTIDGRFELEIELGRGGMGEVWRSRQMPLGRHVALKLLREEYSTLGHLRRRFAREARAAARLNHENIAAVYDFGQDSQGSMFIAMEYIEGPHLGHAIKYGLSIRQIVEIAYRLLDALAHAHARGVVHRDLKPENILLKNAHLPASTGDPKIVDFGIATLRDERQDVRETNHDQVVGTPLYMSPEQASGERQLTPRTDIYSLGMILYELIAGVHPFEHTDSLKVMSDQVNRPLPTLKPRVGLAMPEGLEFIILKALAKSSADRWRSAAFMRSAIEPIRLITLQDERWAALPESAASFQAGEDYYPPTEISSHTPVTSSGEDAKATSIERPSRRNQDTLREQVLNVQRQREQDAIEIDDMDIAMIEPVSSASISGVLPLHSPLSMRHVPFVGRHMECDELLVRSHSVQSLLQGQIVLLDGEAGVGKTRLAMWLKETLEEQGTYRGHIGVFTRGTGNALVGLQEVFESLLRTRGLARQELESHVRERMLQWGGTPSEDDVQAIADFLRPRQSEGRGADSITRIERISNAQLYALLVRLLEMASLTQPRLLVLDDIQWAGEEVVDFLDYLIVEMRLRAMPVYVVATVRQEDLAHAPDLSKKIRHLNRYTDGPFVHMSIDRMSREDGKALLNNIVPLDRKLAEILWERGAGNPLHLILLVRYMVQQGTLKHGDDGSWHAVDLKAVRDAVPPGLAELFKIRLEQLEERHHSGSRLKNLLIRSAILGRRFSYDVLYELCLLENNERLLENLDEDFDFLLSEGFITEVVGRGEEWYTFGHGLMRDVLLEDGVGPAKRKRLHRLAAESMISLYDEQAVHYASQIASHWHAAKQLTEAIEWLWRASQMARRAFRQRDALSGYIVCSRWMEQRLGLTKKERNKPQLIFDFERFRKAKVSRSRYLRTLVYAGDLHEGLGGFRDAERIYRRVVKMCGKPSAEMPVEILVPLCQAWLGLGHIAWQRGDFTAADWAFRRVHDVLTGEDFAHDIANAALRGLARVAWLRGEYDEATSLATSAYENAIKHEDDESQAESLWILGEVARMVAMQSEAQRYFEESLEIYQTIQNPTGIAKILLSQAQLARYNKNFEVAKSFYQKALKEYGALGDRRGQGLCWNGLGESARFEGLFEDARGFYQRALKFFEGIGAQYDVAVTCTNLGLLFLRQRNLEAAEQYLHTAHNLVTEKDYPYLVAGIGYNLALVMMMRGREDEAMEILDPVWSMNERIPMSDLDFAEPLEQLGALRAREGSSQEATQLWNRARTIYEELDLKQDLERLEQMLKSVEHHE